MQQKNDAVPGLVNRTSRVTLSGPDEHSYRHLRHLRERALLTGGVCAEVQASGGDYASTRVRLAITVFHEWIADEFGLPYDENVQFGLGLKELEGLDELYPDMDVKAVLREIWAGASVCQDVQLFWWSDTPMQSARDAEAVVDSLATYFAARSGLKRH